MTVSAICLIAALVLAFFVSCYIIWLNWENDSLSYSNQKLTTEILYLYKENQEALKTIAVLTKSLKAHTDHTGRYDSKN